jgi:hypothetical protein
MECAFHRTRYKRKLEDYSRLEHTASRQPRKYSKDTFKMEFRKNLKTPSEVLGSLQYSVTRGHETTHVA